MIVKKYKNLGYRAELEIDGVMHYTAGWTEKEAKKKAQAVIDSVQITYVVEKKKKPHVIALLRKMAR